MIVELGKFSTALPEIVDQREAWCYLLKNSEEMDERDYETLTEKGKDMSKAVKSLWNLSKDELTRERLEAEETHRRDSVAILEYARNEGIEQGIKKTALSMLAEGFDVQVISRCTGLSLKEVQSLKRSR